MKIVSRLDDLMWEKRVKSLNQLSNETEISRRTLTSLRDNTSSGVQWNTLETLCNFLKCDVDELLVMVSDEEYKKITTKNEEEAK